MNAVASAPMVTREQLVTRVQVLKGVYERAFTHGCRVGDVAKPAVDAARRALDAAEAELSVYDNGGDR